MKINNFLLSLMLCIAAQPSMVLCTSEPTQQETKSEPSYWQMYAPQFMQDATSATSSYIATWIPKSLKDTVNKWSTRKKVAVASAIIASLAAIGYNKDALLSLLYNSYNEEADGPVFIGEETPEEIALRRKESEQERFKYEVEYFKNSITNPRGTGTIPMRPREIRAAYEGMGKGSDPAFIEAVRQLEERGDFKY